MASLKMAPDANRIQVSEHFNLKEFECPHCGAVKISPRLVAALERLRERLQKPLVIASGYRCEAYNATLPGAAPDSRHLYGDGADLRIPPGTSVEALARLAEAAGFTGIGLYPDHLHVDTRPDGPARWDRR